MDDTENFTGNNKQQKPIADAQTASGKACQDGSCTQPLPAVMDAYREARSFLRETDARVLLTWACGKSFESILTHPDDLLTREEADRFRQAAARRRKGEPAAYITGVKEFFSLSFHVNRHVLIPRPDSEILVEQVLQVLDPAKPATVLDLCCGSGCLGIAVKVNRPAISLFMTDISPEAAAVAGENAAGLIGGQCTIQEGDLFSALDPSGQLFEVILSNPPYITEAQMKELDVDIAGYEPEGALNGGPDGLDFYRRIITQAPRYLKDGGLLFLEIGSAQSKSVASLLSRSGFTGIAVFQDYGGHDRVLSASKNQTL